MTQLDQTQLRSTERRPQFWVRRRERVVFSLLIFGPPVLAWVDYLVFGLPPTSGNADPANPIGPHNFPIWLRASHYLNVFFLVMALRSCWRIWVDHPRLSWDAQATLGTEWARWGSTAAHDDPVSNQEVAKGPGYDLSAIGWALTGFVYVSLVFLTGQWRRIVPTSWAVVAEALRVFVQYSTFHLPLDPDGYWRYNSLQLVSYAVVVFLFSPLLILSGLAISPGVGRFIPWLAKLFGNREAARSIHFLTTLAYLAFLAVHVFFVVLYACWLNGNHAVLGTDETGLPGWLIGGVGVGSIALVYLATNRRFAQHKSGR